MRRSRFSYPLPEDLIAQHPAEPRDAARLLCLNRESGEVRDEVVGRLPELLQPGDLLVCNDTKVIPARLFGRKETGGRVELLLERVFDEHEFLAQLHASKPPRAGSRIILDDGTELEVLGREAEFYALRAAPDRGVMQILEDCGHVPLPPYIRRPDSPADRECYQTVFARQPGAVAAPTAGLHFTESLLRRLRECGIGIGFITLHVGAGTFQPVRVEEIEEHRMHEERFEVSAELCARVAATKTSGGRVVAVGTTSVRALETAGAGGALRPARGETGIFIRPGHEFRIVDALLTNFHLPESTLLMLAAAFAGLEAVMHAYEHAIAQRYRFYSYGDAMFIA
jgi:S-adenosylmethionine:tRNA ribosyltransferase-isomerase